MKSLIATKRLRYNTRRLLPGDTFEAKDEHARLLIGIKKARLAGPVAAPAPTKPADSDIAALRAEYERVLGRKPFNGWNAETLRAKIAEAQAD